MEQSIDNIKEALRLIMRPGQVQPITPFLWGVPGIGKSSLVSQLVDEYSEVYKKQYLFIDLRASQIESSDVKGIPHIETIKNGEMEEKILRWITPEDIPTENNPLFKDTCGILFLDEFNRGRPEVNNSFFQLVNDRRIGKHKLLDSWFIVAAGNYGYKDNTDVTELDSALKNRFAHFEVTYKPEQWLEWAKETGINADIVDYLNANNQDLYKEESEESLVGLVTPRSWVNFSKVIDQNPETDPVKINKILGVSIIGSASGSFGKFLAAKVRVSAKDVMFNYQKFSSSLQKMHRDEIQALNTSITSYVSLHFNEWSNEEREDAWSNFYLYITECVREKDLIVAFSKQTYRACQKEGSLGFMTTFLVRHDDLAQMSVGTLNGARKTHE